MKIGIVGTRHRDSQEAYIAILKEFKKVYKEGDMIVSGGCPKGGDRFAEFLAKAFQVPIIIYYAQWTKLGKSAGFARNSDIARESDVLIACVASDRTGGTEDTIRKYLKLGKNNLILC